MGCVKVFLYFIGKPRDPHLNAVAAGFLQRASRYFPCEQREIRPSRFDLPARHPGALKLFLDPAGEPLDSPAFARLLEDAALRARDLVFLAGGHDGIPPAWRPHAHRLLSLSPLTFPHEMARAMLAEQIYRAAATLRGHPYPR
jgi:23S rRNA (pseudouridine1915-N3)-methyltransferase